MYLNGSDQNNIADCSNSIYNQCSFDVVGCNNSIYIADSVKIKALTIKIIGIGNSISIEDGVNIIDNLNINISASNCKINIGKNTTFQGTFISLGDENSYCSIGEDCMFADQSGILASDFHPIIDITTHKRINISPMQHGVTLGSHVWVGFGALILKDVTIGENCVIGAKALVAKDIPAHTVAAGNPAKVIKNNIDWCRTGYFMDNYQAISMDTSIFSETKDVESYLECLDSFGYIRGWAFIKNLDSCYQKIYIEAKFSGKEDSTIYQASILMRGDVVSAYSDSKYLWSGFECQIDNCDALQELNLFLVNGDCKRYKKLK